MKKILLPVDFTEFSDNAIAYALTLIGKMGGELRLIHAFYDPFLFGDEEEISENLRKSANPELFNQRNTASESLKALEEKVHTTIREQHLENVLCSSVFAEGYVEDEILREAARFQPQIILMGAHGHNRLDRMFFGSVTQGVFRHAYWPVMALPHKYAYQQVKEVVYLTDFNENDIYTIGKIINLFAPFQMKLHITHFNMDNHKDHDDAAMRALEDAIRKDYVDQKVECELIDARILDQAYEEYFKNNKIDLVALTTRKMPAFKRLFTHSSATELLYHGEIPLLVFHANEK
ncbi:MAG: universal stress protein [Chitinophagales bacterium]